MDSVDKSAFYIYVISRNKLARQGKGYSLHRIYGHSKFYYINLYYSFEHCLATFLARRLQRAIEFSHLRHFWPENSQPTIVVSGGVACNIRIRTTIEKVYVE